MKRKFIKVDFVPEKSKLVFVKQTQWNNYRIKTQAKALYKCECGIVKEIYINSVKMGKAISCGCYNKKISSIRSLVHGLHGHQLYRIWAKIKARCYNPKAKEFPNYGGRGVIMCEEWKDYPKNFVEWGIANGGKKGLDIDKDIIARKLGIEPLLYSPERCQFVTRKVNLNDKRDNVLVTYNGITQNITQWADQLGMITATLQNRLQRAKWTVEKALTTPTNIKFHQKSYNEKNRD